MLLQVNKIGKNFGGVRALHDISLEVREDQIVSVIGPNGAGKTTLFNVISGIYPHDSGETVFDGKNITAMPQHSIARLGLGRTFQNIRLFSGLNVIENLQTSRDAVAKYPVVSAMLGLPGSRRADKRNREQCHHYLEIVGLQDYAEEQPHNLPYGLQRKVELARALAVDPKLLMLDEPAAGLNPKEVGEFIELIARIQQEQRLSVLIIEHRMRVVNELSNYIYVLNFGELLAHGLPEDVRSNPHVIQAYIGEEG